MTDHTPKWKKVVSIGILASASVGINYLIRLSLTCSREKIIKREHLEEILNQINKANIDKGALASVIQKHPPFLFTFIVSIIGIALTIWAYHQILKLVCRHKNIPNKGMEPTR